eukprot:Awhi_evm1s5580
MVDIDHLYHSRFQNKSHPAAIMSDIFEPNVKLLERLGIQPLASGHLPTQTGTGVQMTTTNPLTKDWIQSYFNLNKLSQNDNATIPLMDIGAAYGKPKI